MTIGGPAMTRRGVAAGESIIRPLGIRWARAAGLFELDPLVDLIEGQGDAEFGDLERPLAVEGLPAPLALSGLALEHADAATFGFDDNVAEDGGH
jgi:hypothetical protein